ERGMASLIQVDEQLGWSYIPSGSQWLTGPGEFRNFVTINSQGLPDIEHDYKKALGTKRVLMLGDSFVAALQVPLEDSFSKVAESLLNGTSGELSNQVEFINAGFAGFGTDQQYRWFMSEGLKYQPDIIVLVVYLGNDISDVDFELSSLGVSTLPSKPFFKIENNEIVDIGYTNVQSNNQYQQGNSFSIVQLRRFLQRNSYLFTIGSGLIKNFEQSSQFRNLLSIVGKTTSRSSYNHSYDIFTPAADAEWERAWHTFELLIKAIKFESDQNQIELKIVMIPHAVQVYPDLWETRKALYPAMDQLHWEMELPNDRLAKFAAEEQIDSLDLLPILIETTSNDSNLYFRTDGHLTQTGNLIVGKAISDWILVD
ncbi:MAG: hypothetical protein ACI9EW_002206, partial [Cellvibrionaceae bacterium]